MKFDKADIKRFEPITITLENELELEFMVGVFNASNAELSGIANMDSSEIEQVLNRTDGYKNTSHVQLMTLLRE